MRMRVKQEQGSLYDRLIREALDDPEQWQEMNGESISFWELVSAENGCRMPWYFGLLGRLL